MSGGRGRPPLRVHAQVGKSASRRIGNLCHRAWTGYKPVLPEAGEHPSAGSGQARFAPTMECGERDARVRRAWARPPYKAAPRQIGAPYRSGEGQARRPCGGQAPALHSWRGAGQREEYSRTNSEIFATARLKIASPSSRDAFVGSPEMPSTSPGMTWG